MRTADKLADSYWIEEKNLAINKTPRILEEMGTRQNILISTDILIQFYHVDHLLACFWVETDAKSQIDYSCCI